MTKRTTESLLVGTCVAAFASFTACPALAQHMLSSSRISITFADPATGFTTRDNNRIDSISWINSDGVSTGNLAANNTDGGYHPCNDEYEFFGESDGYPVQQTAPLIVVPGETAVYGGSGELKARITTKVNKCKNRHTGPLSALSTTVYTLGNSPGTINSVKIVRTFLFGVNTPIFAQSGLRPYMARVSLYKYDNVKLPNSDGVIVTYNDNACQDDCTVTDWNGTWLADDDGMGDGVAIIRSASSMNPAFIVLDADSFSESNVSSVVLAQPDAGWTAPVVETEYLCFYDSTSWPAKRQAAGKLPEGCHVK